MAMAVAVASAQAHFYYANVNFPFRSERARMCRFSSFRYSASFSTLVWSLFSTPRPHFYYHAISAYSLSSACISVPMLSKHSHFHIHLCAAAHSTVYNVPSMFIYLHMAPLLCAIHYPQSTACRIRVHNIHFPLFVRVRRLIFHVRAFACAFGCI